MLSLSSPRLILALCLLVTGLAGPVCAASSERGEDDAQAVPSPREVERDRETSFFGGPFALSLRAGYSGTMWQPEGLGPFDVKSYGRNLLYAEIAIHHPLLIINEALDIVNIPRLRVESNFGYSTQSAGFIDVLPQMIRGNPYLRTTAWMTFWQFFSFRYRSERFDATLTNRYELAGLLETPEIYGTLDMTNKVRDLEIGLIGSTDGEIHDTMIEIGYYHSRFAWPIVQIGQDEYTSWYVLKQADYVVQGLYGGLNTTPIEGIWPMYSQFLVRVGGAFGIDVRFKFEREVLSRLALGIELDGSWRVLQNYETDVEGHVDLSELDDHPRDIRYRLTLYTILTVF